MPLGKNEIRLVLQNSAPTKSQMAIEPRTFSYLAGKDENTGEAFYLEEVVEDMNYAGSPATKGTPAYTQNVGKLYEALGVVAKNGNSELLNTTGFYAMYNGMNAGGWRYQGEFSEWPDEDTPLDFYFWMPVSGNGITNTPTYGKSGNSQTIEFKYTSPATATEQKDLIFAARPLSKSEQISNLPNGTPVLFHHALTGVKFRIANNDQLTNGKEGRTQTYITKVTITGLKNSGTCTITPREETNGYVDDTTEDYSSGDGTFTSGVVSWTYGETTGSFTQEFTEDQNLTQYSGSTTTEGSDGTTTTTSGSFQNKGNYPDSFSEAGNTYNLNDADASMTFWFIPQELTAAVKMEVEFHVWDGTKNQPTYTLSLNLGEKVLEKTGTDLTLTRDWKAGQLRTFSLKPQIVDVDIEDNMNTARTIKSDLQIHNTGNVEQYVRVYIIGNWVGKRQIKENVYDTDETVLMGYTDDVRNADNTDYAHYTEVARWNDKDFTWSGAVGSSDKVYAKWQSPSAEYDYRPYGVFVGLPETGTSSAPGRDNGFNWIRHDKFFYYTLPIGPGEDVPTSHPLFSSYTIGASPVFYIADMTGVRRQAGYVHFVMDVCVQAIAVPYDSNNNRIGYEDAWKAALGTDNINDL